MSNDATRKREWLFIFLKGAGMGAADVVPGVSGGTIAFITGIYARLLNAIQSVNLQALFILKERALRQCGNTLMAIFWFVYSAVC